MDFSLSTLIYILAGAGGLLAAVGGPVVSVLTVAVPCPVTSIVGAYVGPDDVVVMAATVGANDVGTSEDDDSSMGGGVGLSQLKSRGGRVGLGDGTSVVVVVSSISSVSLPTVGTYVVACGVVGACVLGDATGESVPLFVVGRTGDSVELVEPISTVGTYDVGSDVVLGEATGESVPFNDDVGKYVDDVGKNVGASLTLAVGSLSVSVPLVVVARLA